MSIIRIIDLQPVGSNLFADTESFMSELSRDELELQGGGTPSVVTVVATWATVAGVTVTVAAAVGFSVGVTIHRALN